MAAPQPPCPSPLAAGVFDGLKLGAVPPAAAAAVAEQFLKGLLQARMPEAAGRPSVFHPSGPPPTAEASPRPPMAPRPPAALRVPPAVAACDGGDLSQHIMGLLQEAGGSGVAVDAARSDGRLGVGAPTTLEYKGQWQPRPNGAETGHGVVPEEWAIERASENDRALAHFGWAGGAQLCLSNAFHQSKQMEAQAQDLLNSGICTEDDAAVQCILTIARATEERESLMRRQWCDIDFQEGEEANKDVLRHLERDFASQLAHVAERQQATEAARRRRSKGVPSNTDEPDGIKADAPPWYNIKVAGGSKPGKVYLSAKVGGDGVDLCGYDDESGRQRWMFDAVQDEPGDKHRGRLRLLGGTSRSRRLLARAVSGDLELCEFDDGHGRQRWNIQEASNGCWSIQSAMSDGEYLSTDKEGRLCLRGTDDGSSRQGWILPGWPPTGGLRAAGGSPAHPSASSAPAGTRGARQDDVVAIAVRSGSDQAFSLKDLSPEDMTRVLSQNRNLGTAIDLVGAYLKNYEIDKADCLCSRIEPLCRERGGVWLFKFLNFYSTVRMKQSRYQEALDMYKEYETLIHFSPQEAWELYDTVYRNFGWIYTSMCEFEKALEYFEKAVEVKRAHGVPPHWFDQWDLGKTHARVSLQRGKPEDLQFALKLIKEGLAAHRLAEPEDVIMRCKMLNSAGECAAVLGDFSGSRPAKQRALYEEAKKLHQESVDLYMKVLGPNKPLTGWAFEDLAGACRRCGSLEEAKEALHSALRVECSKDIIKLSSMARLLDSVLEVHQETDDPEGLARCQEPINDGLENLQKRRVNQTEAASYAALLRKVGDVLLAHSLDNADAVVPLLEEGIAYVKAAGQQRSANASWTQGDTAGNSGRQDAHAARNIPEEREQLWRGPRAGQQEIQNLDVEALQTSLEHQLLQLRGMTRGVPAAAIGADGLCSSPARAASATVVTESSEMSDGDSDRAFEIVDDDDYLCVD